MCGIFAILSKNPNAPTLTFKGLSDIEYRGYDSWGVAYPFNGSFQIIKQIGFLPKKITFPKASIALGHTRWATHGGVTKENAHPHCDCQGKIVLVHNGIVENYLGIKNKLKNHNFKSETDTEIIVHLIEENLKKLGDFKKAVAAGFNKLEGLNAVVATNGKCLIACKKGSPLVAGKTPDGVAIASDPNALLPHTKELIFMEDNQMIYFDDKIEAYNLADMKPFQPEVKKVEWDHSFVDLKRYKNFMEKEIYEQPKVILNILQNCGEIETVSKMIKKAFGTFLIACGSAAYSCLAGVYLFSKFAKKHVNFAIGSEFNYIEHYLTPESLLISVSQSGETMDVVEPVTSAKKKGTKIVSLVNTLGSSLYRLADYPVMLQAGPEKAVASTKALLAMVCEMILLSFDVAGKRKEGEKILTDSLKEVKSVLKRRPKINELVKKIYKDTDIYIIGRGLSYPVTLEAALKIKECTYIHAEGFAGGELKHGALALIHEGTPVIVFAPSDETKEAILANAMEVKARGGFVIGVSPENNEAFNYHFKISDTGASSILPNIVFAQLLAYLIAIKKGINPDKPRNLAKCVVVR